jgi:3-oxoacyl-[acyl-carrier-protein] synthase-1
MSAAPAPEKMRPLRVVASGICCAVGYNAPAASCALRAGMDNFTESACVADDGSPVRVARLMDEDRWGSRRLAQWARYAIGECLEQIPSAEHERMPLLLLTAPLDRPLGTERDRIDTAQAAAEALEMCFPPTSLVYAGGHAILGKALRQAQAMLQAHDGVDKVLIAGLDSLIDAPTVTHYLRQERLLVPGNSDGFLPGEGAAAIVLERAVPHGKGLHITGIGQGQEAGRPDGSVPSRAQGLGSAMRQAMAQAGIDGNALAFRLSDQNGEAFFAREAANAITRIAEAGGSTPQVLTTADCTGEIGAATGALMLAWLHRYLPHPDAPGKCGLMHLADDAGGRSAIVVRQID